MSKDKRPKTKATVRVNNGKAYDLDELKEDASTAAKDFQAELTQALQRQEEKARAQGIGFSAVLEKTSQDRDGERTVVLKVPRSDRLAIDILSHWDSQPLNVVIAVAEHYQQGSLLDDAGDASASQGDGESEDEE